MITTPEPPIAPASRAASAAAPPPPVLAVPFVPVAPPKPPVPPPPAPSAPPPVPPPKTPPPPPGVESGTSTADRAPRSNQGLSVLPRLSGYHPGGERRPSTTNLRPSLERDDDSKIKSSRSIARHPRHGYGSPPTCPAAAGRSRAAPCRARSGSECAERPW